MAAGQGTGRGTLILVVGPSGVGKDSIIAGTAKRLCEDERIVFARRVITRPAEAGGEDHLAMAPVEFAAWRDAGRLMLHWRAHGFDYGLPQELAAALDEGRSVVANVSRTVVAEARARFAPVLVVPISASAATLAARLTGRGRESPADIDSRLKRAGALPPDQADAVIDNDGALEAAVERFVELVRARVAQPAST
jgi:ribose 1,5-bisphosphokinase